MEVAGIAAPRLASQPLSRPGILCLGFHVGALINRIGFEGILFYVRLACCLGFKGLGVLGLRFRV